MFWGPQMGKGTPMKLKHRIAPYVFSRYVPYIPGLHKPFRGPEKSNSSFKLTIQLFDFMLSVHTFLQRCKPLADITTFRVDLLFSQQLVQLVQTNLSVLQ